MISLEILQSFCAEAAELFGDDWAAVNQHIADKLGALRDSDRRDLLSAVEQILRTHTPDTPAARQLQ